MNAVAPGPFWTALQPSGGQPQENVETFGAEVPLGRPGQPVELAPIRVFLASQEASHVTGEVYGATGGAGTAGGRHRPEGRRSERPRPPTYPPGCGRSPDRGGSRRDGLRLRGCA